MEKLEKEKLNVQELYHIVNSILSQLDILTSVKKEMNFKEAIGKLASLNTDYDNSDINNFVYLLQKLFLNEKKEFEFDLLPVYEIIEANYIRDLFACMMNNILNQKFFNFLIDVGEIFTKLYFSNNNFVDIIEPFEHKNITNYECLLNVLCMGKKNKPKKLIFANYDEYYPYEYNRVITNNLLFAININKRLTTSGHNYKNILNNVVKNLFFKQFPNEKEQLFEIESFIINSINIYWCNSTYYMKESYEDFLTIFYDFITEKNSKKFINNLDNKNGKQDFSNEYLEHISNELMKLFDDFDKNTLALFEKNLYDFIINYKDNYTTNYYIDLILKIQSNNNLSNEIAGLISMICLNKKFMSDMKNEINKKRKMDDIINDFALNDYEIVVLNQLILDSNNKNQKEKSDNISNSYGPINDNISRFKDNINKENKISEVAEVNKNKDIVGFSEKEYTQVNIIKNEKEKKEENCLFSKNENSKYKESVNDLKIHKMKKSSENNEIYKEADAIQNPENHTNKIISENINKDEHDNIANLLTELSDLKIKVAEYKNEFEELKKKSEGYEIEINQMKEMQRKNEEMQRKNEEMQRKNEEMQRKNEEMQKKNEEMQRKNEKINNIKFEKLTNDINVLKRIHEKIFYRDVSKFLIRQFSEKFIEVKGANLYDTCQNILNFDFGKKASDFRAIMMKIVNHYLSGNKMAHIQYLIEKADDSDSNKMDVISSSYIIFMKFSLEEQIKLKESFNFNEASYLLKFK